jgi:bifunctional ADP-heptose synthase (sugar kinase/adenylyltransferase)
MCSTSEDGKKLVEILERAGIGCPWTQWPERLLTSGTTVKNRVYWDGKPKHRVDEDADNRVRMDSIEQYLWDRRKEFDALLISDYQKGIWSSNVCVNQVVDRFRACNPDAIVTANPKPALVKRMTGKVDLLQLNAPEHESLEREELPTKHFLLTRGKRGVMLKSGDHVFHSLIKQPVENADVAGCGDATFAAATLALSAGAEYHQVAMVARRAGTAKARKAGTLPVSVEDIRNELDE